jgi:hypothetical protein
MQINNNYWIKITSGTANNNVRQITGYVGSTKTATLNSVLTSTPTANTDTFNFDWSNRSLQMNKSQIMNDLVEMSLGGFCLRPTV